MGLTGERLTEVTISWSTTSTLLIFWGSRLSLFFSLWFERKPSLFWPQPSSRMTTNLCYDESLTAGSILTDAVGFLSERKTLNFKSAFHRIKHK